MKQIGGGGGGKTTNGLLVYGLAKLTSVLSITKQKEIKTNFTKQLLQQPYITK
jgi:hypothetical protein